MSRSTRALRRQARRMKEKAAKEGNGGNSEIRLSNPVADHFPTFIFGNSTICENVVQGSSGKGKSLIICGAGPTLADNIGDHEADHTWACNSAATWLVDNGHPCTHAFTVDQTAHMLEEWASAPDLEYLLASSCHPHLASFLGTKGRRVTFFHNFVGIRGRPDVELDDGDVISFEKFMYSQLYERTAIVGSGLNAVTRAIDLACFMEYESIKVLGAD